MRLYIIEGEEGPYWDNREGTLSGTEEGELYENKCSRSSTSTTSDFGESTIALGVETSNYASRTFQLGAWKRGNGTKGKEVQKTKAASGMQPL
jgi:hypothetical protein